MKRYSLTYRGELGFTHDAIATPDAEGEWVKFEDVKRQDDDPTLEEVQRWYKLNEFLGDDYLSSVRIAKLARIVLRLWEGK